MKNKITVGFIILHYVSIEETIQCINSILKLKTNEPYKIIIVDNASPNNSGIILKEKYDKSENIEVLLLDSNIGFSKANNYAAQYCLDKYDVQFLVVTNNDVIFIQNDFVN